MFFLCLLVNFCITWKEFSLSVSVGGAMQCESIHPCLRFCASFHPGSFLDSSSALLAVAACTALGEIARNGPLLIPAEGEGLTKLSVVENLLARIPSGKESTKVTQAKRKCSLCHFILIENSYCFIFIYFHITSSA